MQFVYGALLAGAVAAAALRAHALTPTGALAAFCIGTITFGVGGWPATAVLFAFFLPSSALSRLGRAEKQSLVDIGKVGARDAWQVLANGGIATLALLFSLRFGAPALVGFAGAFAAASADTWGTEIGTLARGVPHSILTFRPLAAGLSGGVTIQGTIAEVAGAAFVAIVAAWAGVAPFLPVFIGGVAGALADSILGASLQALRWCPNCKRDCETNPHKCGTPTVVRRGVAWFDNDAVNFAATSCGAILAVAVFLL